MGGACRPEALADFRRALPALGTTDGLVAAATAAARHELPDATAESVQERLQALARRIRSRVAGSDPAALFAHAHDELFVAEAFRGDTEDYHAPRNSYLPAVLARRRGLPIVLCLVYKAVLERLGIAVTGIGAPGHFLALVEVEGAPAYIDPFHGGELLRRSEAVARIAAVLGHTPDADQRDLLPAVDHGRWLQRILRNLEGSFAQLNRVRDRHAVQELELELHRALAPGG